ncbi:MAG: phospholipase D-like domain-containing protein [Pyrinomonadaceae bacterium]
MINREELAAAGDTALRVVASVPSTAGMFRLDQLVAALARERLWITDAYYAATTTFVQGLRSAAKDGVDVRLLVPNGTDIPLLRPLSRSGYRPLLEAGVRVFEWNGTMLHAKTAVADGKWVRVGSTNLNIASWLGNCELDAVVEDESFARQMEEMYLQDLSNATEIVLNARHKMRAPGEPRHRAPLDQRRRKRRACGSRSDSTRQRHRRGVHQPTRAGAGRITHYDNRGRAASGVGNYLRLLPPPACLPCSYHLCLDRRFASLQRLRTAP